VFYLTPIGIVILTWGGWLRIALFLFTYAVLIMFSFAFILRAVENTKKARARRAREVPIEAQRKIDELYRERDEAREEAAAAKKENTALRRTAQERIAFNRYNDSRTKAVIAGKPE
jgi:hypothetical protein